jgi:hypothetical protein
MFLLNLNLLKACLYTFLNVYYIQTGMYVNENLIQYTLNFVKTGKSNGQKN